MIAHAFVSVFCFGMAIAMTYDAITARDASTILFALTAFTTVEAIDIWLRKRDRNIRLHVEDLEREIERRFRNE